MQQGAITQGGEKACLHFRAIGFPLEGVLVVMIGPTVSAKFTEAGMSQGTLGVVMFLLLVPTYLLWYTTMMDFHGQGTGGEVWDVLGRFGGQGVL